MKHRDVSRRTLLKGGGAALAALQVAGPAHAFTRESDQENHRAWDGGPPDPSQSLGQPGDVVIPWLDQPPPFPFPDGAGSQLVWEELDSWLIPPEQFYFVTHFGIPRNLDQSTWRERDRPG